MRKFVQGLVQSLRSYCRAKSAPPMRVTEATERPIHMIDACIVLPAATGDPTIGVLLHDVHFGPDRLNARSLIGPEAVVKAFDEHLAQHRNLDIGYTAATKAQHPDASVLPTRLVGATMVGVGLTVTSRGMAVVQDVTIAYMALVCNPSPAKD